MIIYAHSPWLTPEAHSRAQNEVNTSTEWRSALLKARNEHQYTCEWNNWQLVEGVFPLWLCVCIVDHPVRLTGSGIGRKRN